MLPSPAFSPFRQIMDTWDEYCLQEADRQALSDSLDKNGLILFFKKADQIFGAPEESRVVFAKLKNPDDEMSQQWQDEAKFIAINLLNHLAGEETKNMFGSNDLSDIEILDKDSCVDHLLKHKKGKVK